jgi:tetrahydromethanopterin S-methyltransferase subunit H
MLKFNTEQNVYEVGRIKIGGQPGELPTVLVGSIFWLGQKMVTDANQGLFDAKRAEDIINNMETLSDVTGVPFVLDIVGTTAAAFEKYLDFVAKHTEAPFLLDAMSPRTRMQSAELVKNAGLADRCIYNSFYKGVSKVEAEKVKECGITASIVLADNPKDNSLEGKMQVLEEALALAKEGGITKPLIDTAIPAFEPEMGTAVRAIPKIKEKYGHPTGLGTGNVVTTMGWVKAHVPKEFRKGTRTATNAIMQTMGANWLMFGPAEQSNYVFPAVAIVDTYVASAMGDLGIRPLHEQHPIYKIFL